jgi:hypothetical protein
MKGENEQISRRGLKVFKMREWKVWTDETGLRKGKGVGVGTGEKGVRWMVPHRLQTCRKAQGAQKCVAGTRR